MDNRILYRINRRCYDIDTIKAIKLLKDNNLKVDIHIMPDLPQPFKELTSQQYDELDDNEKT
jgi:histone acetyltransferase (RNA polymerase elongator complex component)